MVNRVLHSTHLPILLLFVLLTVVVTWPLVLYLDNQVIGPFFGDNLEYIWKIWWVKHALVDLNQSPLVQPDIYYPYGYPLAYGEITPLHTFIGLPLTILMGPVPAYNLYTLISYLLSTYFTFLLVKELTKSTPAGLVAGIIFGYCPYRMARVVGTLPLVDTQWIPLCLLFLERAIQRRRWQQMALAGLAFSLAALSSWYYATTLVLLVPVFLLARIRSWHPLKTWLPGGVAFLLVALALVVPFLLPYWSVQRAGAANVPLKQAAFWSAGLADYLTPNPHHFLWVSGSNAT